MLKRSVYCVFVVASVLLLGYSLWQVDYLRIPHTLSWPSLTLSILLCCIGNVAAAMAWRESLRQVGVKASHSVCIAAVGMSIFGKYVPGKVWAIVGQAGYTSSRTRTALIELSGTALSLQILGIWVSLGMGVVGVALLGERDRLLVLAIGVWLLAGAVFALCPTEAWLQRTARRFRLPEPKIKLLRISSAVRVLPWQLTIWGAWTLGFFFLVRGVCDAPMPWAIGLAFPLAASLGIVVVVAPGGLGVREGVLVGSLIACDVSLPDATGVAVAARLWFVVGEVFIFCCGLIAHFVWNVKHSETRGSSESGVSKS